MAVLPVRFRPSFAADVSVDFFQVRDSCAVRFRKFT